VSDGERYNINTFGLFKSIRDFYSLLLICPYSLVLL